MPWGLIAHVVTITHIMSHNTVQPKSGLDHIRTAQHNVTHTSVGPLKATLNRFTIKFLTLKNIDTTDKTDHSLPADKTLQC